MGKKDLHMKLRFLMNKNFSIFAMSQWATFFSTCPNM